MHGELDCFTPPLILCHTESQAEGFLGPGRPSAWVVTDEKVLLYLVLIYYIVITVFKSDLVPWCEKHFAVSQPVSNITINILTNTQNKLIRSSTNS